MIEENLSKLGDEKFSTHVIQCHFFQVLQDMKRHVLRTNRTDRFNGKFALWFMESKPLSRD